MMFPRLASRERTRDAEMYDARVAGVTVSELAQRYGMTPHRVRVILGREATRRELRMERWAATSVMPEET